MQDILRRAALFLFLAFGTCVSAQAQTPASNLAGIKQLHERIDVAFNLTGAGEFGLDAGEITKIVRAALTSTAVVFAKGDHTTPSIKVLIAGESSGGGGSYEVELLVTAMVPSPFANERSIQAILWRDSVKGAHHLRFDPAAKEIVKPSGPMKERVYDSVREISLRLASAFKAT